MVAYFAGSNHGIPKRVLERKHWHTQKFFSLQDQSRPPALSDNRHLSDAHSPSFFYTKEGESEPYAEPKGLRHDLELRFEQGHQHDVSHVPIWYLPLLTLSSTEITGSVYRADGLGFRPSSSHGSIAYHGRRGFGSVAGPHVRDSLSGGIR